MRRYFHALAFVGTLHISLLRSHVEIPIDLAIIAIPPFQPLIRLLEMAAIKLNLVSNVVIRLCIDTHKSLVSAQRTRMHTMQQAMLELVHLLYPIGSWFSPCQEYHSMRPLLSHNVDDFLGKLLPTLLCVTIRFMRSHGQARVQQ